MLILVLVGMSAVSFFSYTNVDFDYVEKETQLMLIHIAFIHTEGLDILLRKRNRYICQVS